MQHVFLLVAFYQLPKRKLKRHVSLFTLFDFDYREYIITLLKDLTIKFYVGK